MDKKTILIIEDDLLSAQYLKEILEIEGFSVVGIINNGKDALETLKDCNVDIVLMDIMLNGSLTGTDVAIKLQLLNNDCKIIFLTAHNEQEIIEHALESSAIAYLMKPYREKEIITTIKMALHMNTKKSINNDIVNLKYGFLYNKKEKILKNFNKSIYLPTKKLKLISTLIKNIDNPTSNEQLCMEIWNSSEHENSLRSLVSRFNKSIDNRLIVSVNGYGYMIESKSSY